MWLTGAVVKQCILLKGCIYNETVVCHWYTVYRNLLLLPYGILLLKKQKRFFNMDESGKLIAVIGDEDTVTGFLLAGVGHRNAEGQNFLVVKPGKNPLIDTNSVQSHNIL